MEIRFRVSQIARHASTLAAQPTQLNSRRRRATRLARLALSGVLAEAASA